MIIGITGTNGSGKGVVVDYLVKQAGFTHYSVREALTKILEERGLPVDRPHLGQLGDSVREAHGAGYFTELFAKEMIDSGVEKGVIESIRSVGEAKALKAKGGIMLAVDADEKVRFKRISGRRSETDQIDFKTFVEQERNEWQAASEAGMNVPAVMAMADYTIKNNGTLAELHKKVEEFLSKYSSR